MVSDPRHEWPGPAKRGLRSRLKLLVFGKPRDLADQSIFHRLALMPLRTWNWRTQEPAIRHIGPVAQDFYAAFGVGEDERHISTVDADGVALAAIQGLYQVMKEQEVSLKEKDERIAQQDARIGQLEAALAEVLKRIASLEEPAKSIALR